MSSINHEKYKNIDYKLNFFYSVNILDILMALFFHDRNKYIGIKWNFLNIFIKNKNKNREKERVRERKRERLILSPYLGGVYDRGVAYNNSSSVGF